MILIIAGANINICRKNNRNLKIFGLLYTWENQVIVDYIDLKDNNYKKKLYTNKTNQIAELR